MKFNLWHTDLYKSLPLVYIMQFEETSNCKTAIPKSKCTTGELSNTPKQSKTFVFRFSRILKTGLQSKINCICDPHFGITLGVTLHNHSLFH